MKGNGGNVSSEGSQFVFIPYMISWKTIEIVKISVFARDSGGGRNERTERRGFSGHGNYSV